MEGERRLKALGSLGTGREEDPQWIYRWGAPGGPGPGECTRPRSLVRVGRWRRSLLRQRDSLFLPSAWVLGPGGRKEEFT